MPIWSKPLLPEALTVFISIPSSHTNLLHGIKNGEDIYIKLWWCWSQRRNLTPFSNFILPAAKSDKYKYFLKHILFRTIPQKYFWSNSENPVNAKNISFRVPISGAQFKLGSRTFFYNWLQTFICLTFDISLFHFFTFSIPFRFEFWHRPTRLMLVVG